MTLRDVSNRAVASIENCESEPIHIPGAIQPHGVLLAIDDDNKICFCSQNCEAAFGVGTAGLLKKSLASIHAGLHQQVQMAKDKGQLPAKPFSFPLGDTMWDVFVSESGELTMVELELPPATEEGTDLFEQTRDFVRLIERSQSLADLCQRIADQTRSLIGFDRVMIYKFDKEANGEVFAESKKEGIEPFLHLHYPHTDIPVQARELYLRNAIRLIADVGYQPVPLLTTDDSGFANLDLSDSVLRSVSPIHIQYLKNMGVGASLSVSLIADGQLWGLIACHHYSPRQLTIRQRQAALLQGYFLSSQLKVRQVAEEYEVQTVVEAHLQQLLNQVPQEGDFPLRFDSLTSLLAVCNSSGVALMHKGRIYEKGLVPSQEQTKNLFAWLADKVDGLQFCTSSLRTRYPEGERISRQAAGILYHKLGDANKDAIIWFREEVERTINWAGDPYDAVRKVQENKLTPRTSFALYKERVRFQSRDWRTAEINAASRFASALQNRFHLDYLKAEEAQQRVLNEQLMKANKELANINWITSHDLKEPLRKILVFSSRMMQDEEKQVSEKIVESVNKIQSSALRMQTLVNDIISYTLIDDKKAAYVHTDLNEVLKEVSAEYEDELQEKGGRIHTDDLPLVTAVPYHMRQLFSNLVGNALKFAKPGTLPEIRVTCRLVSQARAQHFLLDTEKTYYDIEVADNGIGFDPEQGDKLFDIFFRLNAREAYTGTGIGLAICKRIVENHGGAITATGTKGVGASFHIYLPCD